MRKQWFDKRAEDGGYWTVVVKKWEDFEYIYYHNKSFAITPVEYMRYEPMEFIKVKRRPTMGGKMKKEEAIAMAKLLNTTLGESK